jgi:hypothetical protein
MNLSKSEVPRQEVFPVLATIENSQEVEKALRGTEFEYMLEDAAIAPQPRIHDARGMEYGFLDEATQALVFDRLKASEWYFTPSFPTRVPLAQDLSDWHRMTLDLERRMPSKDNLALGLNFKSETDGTSLAPSQSGVEEDYQSQNEEEPYKYVILLAGRRTGSSMVLDLLRSHPDVKVFVEPYASGPCMSQDLTLEQCFKHLRALAPGFSTIAINIAYDQIEGIKKIPWRVDVQHHICLP